jgi:hypothetical protein
VDKVRCSECGFLAVHGVPPQREIVSASQEYRLGDGNEFKDHGLPLCYVNALNLADEARRLNVEPNPVVIGYIHAIKAERECDRYCDWMAGFSPREHQEQMIERVRRQSELDEKEREREWQREARRADRLHQYAIAIGAALLTLIATAVSKWILQPTPAPPQVAPIIIQQPQPQPQPQTQPASEKK